MKATTYAAVFCILAAQTARAALSAATAPVIATQARHKEVALFPARKRGLQLASTKTETVSPDAATAGAAAADDRGDEAQSPADQDDFGGASAPPRDGDSEAGVAAEPVLPPISAMTGTASETIKGINSQASILEARVAQAQMENEARLARQKAVFEQKLQDQDRKNRAVMTENSKISQQIETLKSDNENMRKRAQDLQEENKFKRTELKTLRERLNVASDFITKGLKATDDHKSQELAILQASQVNEEEHHHVFSIRHTSDTKERREEESEAQDDDDDSVDDKDTDGDEEDSASLLAVSATVRRASLDAMEESQLGQMADVEVALSGAGGIDGVVAPAAPTNPRDLITVLSSGIDSLSKQERASEAKLRTMFLTRFKAGTKSHTALLTHQTALNSTRASLLSVQSQLRVATSHLDTTRGKLAQELHGLGTFLQRLAHLALTPSEEAPGLLKALPDKIAVPERAAAVAEQGAAGEVEDR